MVKIYLQYSNYLYHWKPCLRRSLNNVMIHDDDLPGELLFTPDALIVSLTSKNIFQLKFRIGFS